MQRGCSELSEFNFSNKRNGDRSLRDRSRKKLTSAANPPHPYSTDCSGSPFPQSGGHFAQIHDCGGRFGHTRNNSDDSDIQGTERLYPRTHDQGRECVDSPRSKLSLLVHRGDLSRRAASALYACDPKKYRTSSSALIVAASGFFFITAAISRRS